MAGTAIDLFFAEREQVIEATRIEARRQETDVKLFRFTDQMEEVVYWGDEREREIWMDVCLIAETMRSTATQMNRPPQRLLSAMVPATGPVYRCSFVWELGAPPQPGDILLALLILACRQISAEERQYHIDFLGRHSREDEDRQYWKTIKAGKQPSLSVWEQIRQQAKTEMAAKRHSKGVVWTPVAAQTTCRDIEEI